VSVRRPNGQYGDYGRGDNDYDEGQSLYCFSSVSGRFFFTPPGAASADPLVTAIALVDCHAIQLFTGRSSRIAIT
jgi:hypothetical protein